MRITRVISLSSALAFTALLSPSVVAQSEHDDHKVLHSSTTDANLVREVRTVTRPFLDVNAAVASGYGPFLGCVSGGAQPGAMGTHYVNGEFVGDGLIDVEKPEALMYERRNGRLHLLGVEFIVMVDAWHAKNAQPPVLMGQVFTYNGSPNRYGLPPFYALHVWAWRDNPGGAFVDWNTQVSCEGVTSNP